MTNYLLGELSDEEQTNFEIRYLADDSLFEQMLLIRQDLIDGYIRHHLDAQTREKFERHILATPEGQKDVAFASALREKLNQSAEPNIANVRSFKLSDWLGVWSFRELTLVGASVVLSIFGVWLWKTQQPLNTKLASNNPQTQPTLTEFPSPNPTAAPSPILTPSPSDSTKHYDLLTINLLGSSRSSLDVTEILLPGGDYRPHLNVRLGFEPVAMRCHITLKTPDGRTFARNNAPVYQQDGYFVRMDFPQVKLKAGNYEVIIQGRDADDNAEKTASRFFRLVPKTSSRPGVH